jgi:hypothetical protein
VAQYNANYDEWLAKGATEDSIALNSQGVMIRRIGELDQMLEAARGTTTKKCLAITTVLMFTLFLGIPACNSVVDASQSNSQQTLNNN